MLLLTRKIGETIVINSDITLTILEIRGTSVKLGFAYPSGHQVLRGEVFDRIQQENKTAAASTPETLKILGEHLKQSQDQQ